MEVSLAGALWSGLPFLFGLGFECHLFVPMGGKLDIRFKLSYQQIFCMYLSFAANTNR